MSEGSHLLRCVDRSAHTNGIVEEGRCVECISTGIRCMILSLS